MNLPSIFTWSRIIRGTRRNLCGKLIPVVPRRGRMSILLICCQVKGIYWQRRPLCFSRVSRVYGVDQNHSTHKPLLSLASSSVPPGSFLITDSIFQPLTIKLEFLLLMIVEKSKFRPTLLICAKLRPWWPYWSELSPWGLFLSVLFPSAVSYHGDSREKVSDLCSRTRIIQQI